MLLLTAPLWLVSLVASRAACYLPPSRFLRWPACQVLLHARFLLLPAGVPLLPAWSVPAADCGHDSEATSCSSKKKKLQVPMGVRCLLVSDWCLGYTAAACPCLLLRLRWWQLLLPMQALLCRPGPGDSG
jgi:hypothetical protein